MLARAAAVSAQQRYGSHRIHDTRKRGFSVILSNVYDENMYVGFIDRFGPMPDFYFGLRIILT
jgi:hypothetical protein